MSSGQLPQTRAEIIARMEQARQDLEQSFSHLSDAQLDAPSTSTDWSVKNHLTHLVAWLLGTAALLHHQPRWSAIGIEQQTFLKGDEDEINEVIYQRWKDHPLAEVRAAFDGAHRGVIAALDALSDDDLARPYSSYQPEEPGDNNNPIAKNIAGDTYGHYAEHQTWIAELIHKHGWS